MRFLSIALAAFIGVAGLSSFNANAADVKPQTVAAVYKDKATLAGKTISAQGKVVKVNNGIMGRNFVHIQDGSGDAKAGTNDLLVTSKQVVTVGDQVTISGKVVLNRDFGSGYKFNVIVEDATVVAQ